MGKGGRITNAWKGEVERAEIEQFKEREWIGRTHRFALFRYLRGQHTEGGRHGMGKREDMYGVIHSVRVRKERKEGRGV